MSMPPFRAGGYSAPPPRGGAPSPSVDHHHHHHQEEEEEEYYEDEENYEAQQQVEQGPGYEVLADQRPFVKTQLENGLYVVKRFCQYLQRQSSVQAKLADEMRKLAEHEIGKKKYDLDQSGADSLKCLNTLFNGHVMIAQAAKNFADKTNSEIVDVGLAGHKEFENQEARLAKQEQKLEQAKSKQESILEASRSKSISEWNKLSAAKKAIDKAYKERNDPKNVAKVGKIDAKIKKLIKAKDKQRQVTQKAFAGTEELNDKTNVSLSQFHNQDIPQLMQEFQQLDRDRLEVLRESMDRVIRLHQEYSQAMLQTLSGMQEALRQVNSEQQVAQFAVSCSKKFKPPVGHEDQFSGLPCSASFLERDSGTLCDLLNIEVAAAVIRRKNGDEPLPEGPPHHETYVGGGGAGAGGGGAGGGGGGPPPRAGAGAGGPPPRGLGSAAVPQQQQHHHAQQQEEDVAEEDDYQQYEDNGAYEAEDGLSGGAELGEDRWVQAIYEFEPEQQDELRLNPGDMVLLLEDDDPEWWKGQRWDDDQPGPTGIFPKAFVQAVQ